MEVSFCLCSFPKMIFCLKGATGLRWKAMPEIWLWRGDLIWLFTQVHILFKLLLGLLILPILLINMCFYCQVSQPQNMGEILSSVYTSRCCSCCCCCCCSVLIVEPFFCCNIVFFSGENSVV